MFQLEKLYGKSKEAKEFIKELTKGALDRMVQMKLK